MKKRFSSHIMPHRIVKRFLWLLVDSGILYAVYFVTSWVWRSVMYTIPHSGLLIYPLLAIGMAAFPAFMESVRLDRDIKMRGDFRSAYEDGSYDRKQDANMLWHCDELWNDTAVVAVTYLLFLLVALAGVFLSLMTDPYLFYEEVIAYFRPLALLQIPFYILFVGMYAFWHHRFTLRVHTRWNASRMHTVSANEVTGEGEAEKKPFL